MPWVTYMHHGATSTHGSESIRRASYHFSTEDLFMQFYELHSPLKVAFAWDESHLSSRPGGSLNTSLATDDMIGLKMIRSRSSPYQTAKAVRYWHRSTIKP